MPEPFKNFFNPKMIAQMGSKKGKAVAKALRGWLTRNGYEAELAALDLRPA